jgi:glutathione S-transferase
MANLTLYFAPGACSRVPLIALEELGIPFEAKLIRFMKGEHRSLGYLRLNPKGKVPLLVVDDRPLSENVAILTYLAKTYPRSNLLPFGQGAMDDAQLIALLAWCSSGMHPIITRIRLPQLFCASPDGRDSVRSMAMEAMRPNFALVDAALAHQPWMLSSWSMIDAYLYWIWFRSTGSGFDASSYPHFAAHAARMEARPSVQRTLEREAEAERQLAQEGASFAPADVGK